jgi:energy-coupling factor transporter transmembrane protein EcfT
MEEDILHPSSNSLSEQTIDSIAESSKYARFIGLIVMIVAGLQLILGVIGLLFSGAILFSGDKGGLPASIWIFSFIFVLGIIGIAFYAAWNLYRYGKITQFLSNGELDSNLQAGIKHLTQYLKIMAIVLGISIVLYVLVVLINIVFLSTKANLF